MGWVGLRTGCSLGRVVRVKGWILCLGLRAGYTTMVKGWVQ